MPLKGIWIDPSDDDATTVVGSPDLYGSPASFITAIKDKSDSLNHVAELGSPESAPTSILVDGKRAMRFESGDSLLASPIQTSLLASFDGIDGRAGSPEYISEDSNAQVATFVSGAVLDDAEFKFGSTSLLVKGTADGVTFPSPSPNNLYNFGDGDFTIEMWVRFDASPTGNKMFIGQWLSPNLSWVWLIVSGALRFDRSTNGTAQTTVVSNAFVPSSGQWYHIAVVRNGTQMQQWIDGVAQGSPSATIGTSTLFNSAADVEIGWYVAGGFGHDGWIDDIRVTKGLALYEFNTNFALPTEAYNETVLRDMGGPDFTAIAAIGDNSREISELLIDWELETGSPDGVTAYVTDDAVGRTLTFTGSAQLDTAQKRFGRASLFTTTNSTARVPSAVDLTIGTQDFTIEFWARASTTTSTRIIFDNRSAATSAAYAIYTSSGQLRYYVNGADRITGSTLTTGVWYHICVTRKSGVTKMFVDGVQVGSDWTDSTNYIQNIIEIGGPAYTTGNNWDGWIDAIRLIVGLSLPPDATVFGVTGDASPLDATGWRMNRLGANVLNPSVGDAGTNVATVDGPVGGDIIASVTYDSVAQYLVSHANGVPGDAVAYSGSLGFAHNLIMGELPGDFLELVIANGVLRTDERQRVEGYLAHKWNLRELLPLNHPFYGTGPDIVVDAAFIANFNGVDGDTTYTAETGQVATFVADAQLDNAQQYFGATESPIGTSVVLDGTGDYVSFPDSADYDFVGNDFTIEFFVRFNGDPGTGNFCFVSKWLGTGNQRSWNVSITNNLLRFAHSVAGSDTNTDHDQAWNPAGDTWYHVAFSKKTKMVYHFVDGVQLGTALPMSESIFSGTAPLLIGAVNDPSIIQLVNGWIDSVRIVNGEGIYQHDFTPPLREFQVPVYASLLANFNVAESATSPPTVTEESVNAAVMEFENGANIDTAQKKFGISSAEFPNATSAVRMPNIADYDFGTGDFTIELWVRTRVSKTAAQVLYENRVGTPVPVIYINNSGTLHYYVDSNRISTSGGAIAIDTWYHIAVARESGVTKMFLDGVKVGADYSDANNYAPTADLILGNDSSGTAQLEGWLDGVRVVKGTALYTAAFTVPFDAPGEPIV